MSAFAIEPPLPADVKRLLVVGGTFDPPHRAHVRLAIDAAQAAACDHVLFIPAGQSPLKDQPAAPAAHRVAMLRLAIGDQPRASLSTFEIDRPGRSYTEDTLSALRQALPADVELRLFMGSDQLRSFSRWRQPERIAQLARPVVVLRPPDTRESLRAHGVPESQLNWIVDVPVDDVSSTAVREALAYGGGADALIEPRVRDYIRAHHLYKKNGTGTFCAATSTRKNVPVPFVREPLDRLLARLVAAGVPEPSTLVIECAGEPRLDTPPPRTAMSSRVHVSAIQGAAFHNAGLADGYCTYAIHWGPAIDRPREVIDQLTDLERIALGLRDAVQAVQAQGVPVRRFVLTGYTDACGSIDRTFAQAIADVLDTRVSVRPCRDVAERGGDILRQLQRDRQKYTSVSQAVKTLADMEGREQRVWRNLDRARQIARLLKIGD